MTANMPIELNFKSGKPAYVQIAEQVKHAVACGRLREGEQLPSLRELAERLRVNRNTVARAYGELEREGVVESSQGRGVFIRSSASSLTKKAREELAAQAIDAALVQAHQLRIGRERFLELVARRLDEFEKRRSEA